MEKKTAVVGVTGLGFKETTLASAITSVIEKQEHEIIAMKEPIEQVFVYENPYRFLNEKKSSSKSRLKKCEKGLHEFIETTLVEDNIKRWACIHCGTFMHNR